MLELERAQADGRSRVREIGRVAERLRGVAGVADEGGVRATVSAVGALQDLELAEWVLAGGAEEASGAILGAVEAARLDAEEQVAGLVAGAGAALGGVDPEWLGELLAGRVPVAR